MNGKMNDYLQSLDVSTVVYRRVLDIHDFYRATLPGDTDIIDLFITEYLTDEGIRTYENLWFFSANYIMEAQNFLHTDRFDLILLKENVVRWDIRGRDYNYRSATKESRLQLEITFGQSALGNLRASQENCDHLMRILKEQFMPNVGIALTKY